MWKQGDGNIGEKQLKAGVIYYLTLEMNWLDEEISPDFSVVVYGMGNGNVHI